MPENSLWDIVENIDNMDTMSGIDTIHSVGSGFYRIFMAIGLIGIILTMIVAIIRTIWTRDSRMREQEKRTIQSKFLFTILFFAIPMLLDVAYEIMIAFANIK